MSEEHWMEREPWVLYDEQHKREWLIERPLEYYLNKGSNGMWCVVSRYSDLGDGPETKTRAAAIRQFFKRHGRPMPRGDRFPKAPSR